MQNSRKKKRCCILIRQNRTKMKTKKKLKEMKFILHFIFGIHLSAARKADDEIKSRAIDVVALALQLQLESRNMSC